MRVLVFGQTGQVARELARCVPHATFLSRAEVDLSKPESCAAAIVDNRPDAIINAAAYTDVDRAEEEEELASIINGDAVEIIAKTAKEFGIPFVHISTDYVFDGAGRSAWRPDDNIAPLGAYGRSKAQGESGIRSADGCHAILRTSWVFSSHGNNFVKTMLRLGAERNELKIVSDQIGGPTAAGDIADACLKIAARLSEDNSLSGTYHFSGAPDVSWADFARAIFELAGLSPRVIDISTSDFPTPARRPANSRLDCSSLKGAFSIKRPDWRESLKKVLTELGALRT